MVINKAKHLIISEKLTDLIQSRTKSLLYITEDEPREANFGSGIAIKLDIFSGKIETEKIPTTDPSTIFLKALIRKPGAQKDVDDIGYYPTYLGLTPEQRWIYLDWLNDIKKPIDIGYVFIYYYGLERQLLLGNFDDAFNEILILKQHHHNNSFTRYSDNALLYSCILRKRGDFLEKLNFLLDEKIWHNLHLLLAYKLQLDLAVENLMAVVRGLVDLNKRYIKNRTDEYKHALKEVLINRYHKSALPLTELYSYEKLPKTTDFLFANISFPDEIRSTEVPSFVDYKPFTEEVASLHKDAHERVKFKLKKLRKHK